MSLYKWDVRFLRLAKEIASWSKDPSTQTGAVIVNDNNEIVATGFNGFPRWLEDKKELLENRDEKYKRIIHCEMNAILFSKCDLNEHTLYTWPDVSCSRCAAHVIQTGISSVVFPVFDGKGFMAERWGEDMALSKDLFTEASVNIREIEWQQFSLPASSVE